MHLETDFVFDVYIEFQYIINVPTRHFEYQYMPRSVHCIYKVYFLFWIGF